MEKVSNCCGASIDGLNADNIGICSECKEGCGVEEVWEDDKADVTIEGFLYKLPKKEE